MLVILYYYPESPAVVIRPDLSPDTPGTDEHKPLVMSQAKVSRSPQIPEEEEEEEARVALLERWGNPPPMFLLPPRPGSVVVGQSSATREIGAGRLVHGDLQPWCAKDIKIWGSAALFSTKWLETDWR